MYRSKRRGVGDLQVVTDPVTGQQMVTGVVTGVNVPESGAATYYDLTSGAAVPITPAGGSSSGITSWLSQNTGLAIGIGGAIAFLLVLMGGRRR